MPRTVAQLKARLSKALAEASEAEEVLELVRQAIAQYQLQPDDVFPKPTKLALARGPGLGSQTDHRYADRSGNTWTEKGRRPNWLRDAIAAGADLDTFRIR